MRIRWEYKAIVFCVFTAVLASVPSRLSLSEPPTDRAQLTQSISHHIMAVIADFNDQSQEAIREYQKAVDFNPNSYLSRLRLGAHFAKDGKLNDALIQLSKVPYLNPDGVQARYLLALIYSAQKQFDKAVGEYEIILNTISRENPENINIFFYLGQLYYAQHRYDKAVEQFQRIIDADPQNVEMLSFMGALFVELGRDEQAKMMFKKVLELDNSNDMALNSLGYIYAEQGNHLDEALRLANRALERIPDSAAYKDTLGWIYYKQGRYQESLQVLIQANEKLTDPIILEHLGDVYLAIKEFDKAKDYWNRALVMVPGQKKILEKINRLDVLQNKPTSKKTGQGSSEVLIKQ
ncbi:MAG: tetratricopeptide repeat protein [Candidatus Omnitrophica bacterium]|nr:tetratricopeptide repeat protein [Candidatus Omnitrophota bacterium]